MLSILMKTGLKIVSPKISADVVAKTQNQAGKITSNLLKSLLFGSVLKQTDLLGIGSRLKLM